MPIKVYTQQSFLSQEHRSHIFFIFLELCYTKKDWIKAYFSITSNPNNADYFVWPLCVSYTKRIGQYKDYLDFIKQADAINKKVWVYTGGDEGWSHFKQPKQSIHFRLAGFKSTYKTPTEVLPAFIQDPIIDKELGIIKNPLPPYSLGFVGYAHGSRKKWIKECLIYFKKQIKRIKLNGVDYQSFYPSGIKRFHFLEKLKRVKSLKANYILRNQYRAGVVHNDSKKKSTEDEFKENIKNNLFTFCMRGGGNFSIRFYEILAQGRIPLYLETDTQLPCEDKIQWDNHILRIHSKNLISEIEIKLKKFTQKNDLETLQLKNRKLWEEYLTRKAYAKQLFLKYKPE